jgi:hypothetical protein
MHTHACTRLCTHYFLWRLRRFAKFIDAACNARATFAAIIATLAAAASHAVIPVAERAILQSLYTSTGGAGWTNSNNWNEGVGTECG